MNMCFISYIPVYMSLFLHIGWIYFLAIAHLCNILHRKSTVDNKQSGLILFLLSTDNQRDDCSFLCHRCYTSFSWYVMKF